MGIIKRIGVIFLAFLLMAGVVWADSYGSGEQTADAAIYAGQCVITAVRVITDGTNNAKVIVYDHASAASGTVRLELTAVGNTHHKAAIFYHPKTMFNGIYVDVSGTGASYIIEYVPR